MGFSISAAAAIIGVSVLMILEISLGTLMPVYTDIQESYDDMRDRAVEGLQTSITITYTNTTVNASGYDLNVTLENSGSTTVDTQYLDVLINGVPIPFSCDSSYIYPENNASIHMYGVSGSGENKIKIITENGISCYDSYMV